MKRRDLSALLALAPLADLASAQGAPVEGKHYIRLGQALPSTPGKIEVVEFFFYLCPHCFAFDPVLEQWLKTLPADVSFRRVPIGTQAQLKLLAKAYYGLESLGQTHATHSALFNAIHRERLDLSTEDKLLAFLGRIGQDPARVKQAMNSFGVQTKAQQGLKLAESSGVDSVPQLTIAGRWRTGPGIVGAPGQAEAVSGQQACAVADYLIKQARGKA